jgi:hypothetical protein
MSSAPGVLKWFPKDESKFLKTCQPFPDYSKQLKGLKRTPEFLLIQPTSIPEIAAENFCQVWS